MCRAGSGHGIGPSGTGVKAKTLRPDQMEAGRSAPALLPSCSRAHVKTLADTLGLWGARSGTGWQAGGEDVGWGTVVNNNVVFLRSI